MTDLSVTIVDEVYDLLVDNDWREMLAVCREWYQTQCPRYTPSRIEAELSWVGTMLIRQSQYQRVHGLTPDVFDRLRSEVEAHFANATATYRRHCLSGDRPEPAEMRVEAIARRLGI